MDKKGNGNGLLKKTKPISLTPCSDNTNTMWTSAQTPEIDPDVQIVQLTAKPSVIPISKSVIASSEKKDKSPLEATFTHPNEPLEDKPSDLKQKQRKTKTDYTALEFISTSSQANSLTLSINAEDKQLTERVLEEDEKLCTALIALFISIFSPLWCLGMAYWHFVSGDLSASLISLVILGISTLAVHMAFFTARSAPKKKMWKASKFMTLLAAIPGLTSVILSFCNVIFAVKETKSRSYERPWSNTRFVFLVESLALAFPQNVLMLLLISEDAELIHSIKGYVTILGLIIFSFTMTFARFRYDSQIRHERFGTGFEKYVRFLYLWANKVLWFVTYSIVIISLRLVLPMQKTTTTIIGVGLLLAILEAPILFTMTPACSRVAQSMLGVFMMIPQFVSLAALIVWVNVDPSVYSYESGSFILGLFFYAELITLTCWLYDRCMGRDIDFLPVYPHFFGDLRAQPKEYDH